MFLLGIGDGDWGLGIGDWGLGPIPNPQSPKEKENSYKFHLIINYLNIKLIIYLFLKNVKTIIRFILFHDWGFSIT